MRKLQWMSLALMLMACPGKMVSGVRSDVTVAVTETMHWPAEHPDAVALPSDLDEDDPYDLLAETLRKMIERGGFGHLDPDPAKVTHSGCAACRVDRDANPSPILPQSR